MHICTTRAINLIDIVMKILFKARNIKPIRGLQCKNKDSKSEMPANKLADTFNTDKLAILLYNNS